MEVEKSSRRSCFTQTSCLGEDLGEDSQLEYLSAYEEYEEEKNNLSKFPEQGDIGEGKHIPVMGDKVPPEITAGEERSGKSERPAQSMAVEPDLSLPPREKAKFCKHAEPSDCSSCGKPAVCTCGTSSSAEDAESQLPVPETLPGKDPGTGTEAAGKCCGSLGAEKPERREALRSIPSVSMAVQAMDAGSDSRAGFPASRSSSAQACLCSRAVNTEFTMMNKTQPVGWLGQTSADAASNTEWSFRAQSSHLQESKYHLCICDWKTGADRPEQPNKQTGKNSACDCCQNILQRAAEAELQLLAVHYKMCYQHCMKVYELALDENTCFGRCEKKTELYSSLLLVLDELENNYSNMKMEITMGIPLSELPPLSVELKFAQISSFYVPSKFFGRSLYSDDLSGEGKADLEESKQQENGISINMDKSQTDGDHQGDSASPEAGGEHPKDQALERRRVKNEEGSEYWFDAKEDLSVADISVVCKETKKRQGKQDSIDSRGCPKSTEKMTAQEELDPGEKSLQKTSTCSFVNPSGVFVSPYALNLSSFTKLIKRLQERHPECSRDEIVEAVQEVRKINKGVLCGLAISSIEEKASAVLRRSVSCAGQEKH